MQAPDPISPPSSPTTTNPKRLRTPPPTATEAVAQPQLKKAKKTRGAFAAQAFTIGGIKRLDLPTRNQIFFQFIRYVHEVRKDAMPAQADLDQVLKTFSSPKPSRRRKVSGKMTPTTKQNLREAYKKKAATGVRQYTYVVQNSEGKLVKGLSWERQGAGSRPAADHLFTKHSATSPERGAKKVVLTPEARRADQFLKDPDSDWGGAIYIHQNGEKFETSYIGKTDNSIRQRTLDKLLGGAGVRKHSSGEEAERKILEMPDTITDVLSLVPLGEKEEFYESAWMLIAKNIFGFELLNSRTKELPNKWLRSIKWPSLVKTSPSRSGTAQSSQT